MGYPHLAAPAREASGAGAHRPILQIVASAPVGTGTSGTITDVQFTVGACESRPAAAGSAWTSVQALASIGTRVAGTPVYFLLTVRAGKVGGAFAGITGPLAALPARAPIEAG